MRAFSLVWLLVVAAGCGRPAATDTADAGAVTTTAGEMEIDAGFLSAATELPAAALAGGVRPLSSVPSSAGEKARVEAGVLVSGSTPGDEGRNAAVEPVLVEVELGAFAIDALPYPNDPTRAPQLVGSQSEAERLCGERGARLCTELEWERACKGPGGDRYSTGEDWNVDCDRSPSRCASGFGARAMGFMQEWTDSRAALSSSGQDEAIVRGGSGTSRRCASRSLSTAKGMPGELAFRCCHGDRNSAVVAPIEPRPGFRKTNLEEADLEKIFAGQPELRRISEGLRLFGDGDIKSIVARGAPRGADASGRAEGISFATTPILWSPEPGVELLVTTGRTKKTAFVVALWTLPQGKYRVASSFLFLGDVAPVALAYEPSRRKELRWTRCWGCAGEQGAVTLRDDGRVVIVQY